MTGTRVGNDMIEAVFDALMPWQTYWNGDRTRVPTGEKRLHEFQTRRQKKQNRSPAGALPGQRRGEGLGSAMQVGPGQGAGIRRAIG